MPSTFAHAAPALALIPAFSRAGMPARLWVIGVASAAAPDLDVLAFSFGIPYEHPLGHRGLWHSVPFAAAAAAVVAGLVASPSWPRAWLYLFLVTASHGVLDAFTNGGLGVALLSPFDDTRYFFPFRPIQVSPLSIGAFFSERGLAILASELLWVWLPCAVLGLALVARSCRRRRDAGRPRAVPIDPL
jgi:inner membrane protein